VEVTAMPTANLGVEAGADRDMHHAELHAGAIMQSSIPHSSVIAGSFRIGSQRVSGRPVPAGGYAFLHRQMADQPGARATSTQLSDLRGNDVLTAMDADDLQRIEPHLELVRFKERRVLHDTGEIVRHVYFPRTCVVSLIVPMQSGGSAEICMIGSEGADCSGAMADCRALAQSLILVPGEAYRVPVKILHAAMTNSPRLRTLIDFHTVGLLAQSLQAAGCHALHPAQARLARFLLTLGGKLRRQTPLPLTQELLAGILGVQRTTVTTAAEALQRAGLIAYRRGRVEICNAQGLAQAACECHAAIEGMQRRYQGRRALVHAV